MRELGIPTVVDRLIQQALLQVLQPLIDAPPPVHPYKPGTWGPDAADELVADFGGWREPWSEDAG